MRFSQKDDIWLSPCYGVDVAWIGIIVYRPYGKDVAFQAYFEAFQNLMMEFSMPSCCVSSHDQTAVLTGPRCIHGLHRLTTSTRSRCRGSMSSERCCTRSTRTRFSQTRLLTAYSMKAMKISNSLLIGSHIPTCAYSLLVTAAY